MPYRNTLCLRHFGCQISMFCSRGREKSAGNNSVSLAECSAPHSWLSALRGFGASVMGMLSPWANSYNLKTWSVFSCAMYCSSILCDAMRTEHLPFWSLFDVSSTWNSLAVLHWLKPKNNHASLKPIQIETNDEIHQIFAFKSHHFPWHQRTVPYHFVPFRMPSDWLSMC